MIDLKSQAKEVAALTLGWSTPAILTWLAERGALMRLDVAGTQAFRFESTIGLIAHFVLDGDQFTFIGDNTSWRPK